MRPTRVRWAIPALCAAAALALVVSVPPVCAQTAPSTEERAAYRGLHAAVAQGDVAAIHQLAKAGADLNVRDGHGRTPLMVAAHRRDLAAARTLIAVGAEVSALDSDRYDVVTIAAVNGRPCHAEARHRVGGEGRAGHQPL